jgi:hypothetical protein
MKPRLEAAPLTEEDSWIWHIVSVRFDCDGPGFRFTSLWTPALNGDRRDAELMFLAQRARSYTFPVDLPPLYLLDDDGSEVPCGGPLEEWHTLNITYFA